MVEVEDLHPSRFQRQIGNHSPPQLGYYTLEFATWKLKIDPIEKEFVTSIFQITLW